jgi:hypothetical protein
MEKQDWNPLMIERQRYLYQMMTRHMNPPKQTGGKKKTKRKNINVIWPKKKKVVKKRK